MFTHLHVHTEYSLLDGLSRINPLVERAGELGMDSLAITDHGGLYGAIDFYRTARAAGIKPIIGCEMYVAPGSRHGRDPTDKSPFHLTVLAKNRTGYLNLVKLVTASHLEGFYYKPRVDREVLERHSDGLTVLSGCPSGEVPKLLAQGRVGEAKAAATWYRERFDGYYLELMEHGGVPELPAINAGLMDLHRETDIPLVATNDSHYVRREDAPLQDILICIHTNTNVEDDKRLKMDEDSYYLRTADEMEALYPDLPEAISNTRTIAESCELELDFSQLHMPEYPVPDGLTPDEYLGRLCREGLKRRFQPVTEEASRRLDYELEVVKQTRYANYFLVVWDIARYTRENDIYLAVRGSAAASIVLYCLGVTDIDPLRYRLVFERFLNVERKEMPDIDMDFQDDRREEVLNYVVSKYGRDRVAQIITFGTLGARASIRDVGRALAMPYEEVDRVARLVPGRLHMTLDKAREETPELQEIYEADEGVHRLVDTARKLEGLTRHSSTHAAGVVISKEPLDTYVPLQRPAKGGDDSIATTQYAMEPIADLGLLKLDMLGLANLTILARARDLIASTRGVDVSVSDIPLDDPETFEMLSRGETVGVFQLEGAGMTRHIKELKPSSVGDVAAMIALYRPGPMEQIDTFIAAKHGRAEVSYIHPALRDILEETYGVIVYQDQVLLIAQAFAGYSLGEADIVRKAMGKKIPEIMAEERDKFIQGALEQGHSRELAEQVFALVEPFAGYAFNKAHSVSYGLISYWTAYLKAQYPAEYMASLLNAYVDNTARIAVAVSECARLRIPVRQPDINSSDVEHTIEHQEDGAAIRFGLSSIKNVGVAALTSVVESRKSHDGPYQSIEQMCREADMSGLNRKTLESLVKAGAFDSFGSRGGILEVVGRILSLAQSEAGLRDSNQASMFDLFGESVPTPLAHISIPEIDVPESEQRAWETELMGVALSGSNPLQTMAYEVDGKAVALASEIDSNMAGKTVELVGQVASSTERFTRENKPFVIATIAMLDGEIELFVWEDRLRETQALWSAGTLVRVTGRVRARGDEVSVSCVRASPYEVADDDKTDSEDDTAVESRLEPERALVPTEGGGNGAALETAIPKAQAGRNPPNGDATHLTGGQLTVRIRETDSEADDQLLLADVKALLLEHQGEDPVRLEIARDERVVVLDWPILKVNICSPLEEGLKEVLGGTGQVRVEEASAQPGR